MKYIIILFSILLVSCGRQDAARGFSRPKVQHNSIFNPYMDRFESEMAIELNQNNFAIGDIPIIFENMDDGIGGICYSYFNGKLIKINPNYWSRIDDWGKRELIFHELGHCRLNRDHNNETYTKSGKTIRKSLMYYMAGNSYYRQFDIDYDRELATGNSSSLIAEFIRVYGL